MSFDRLRTNGRGPGAFDKAQDERERTRGPSDTLRTNGEDSGPSTRSGRSFDTLRAILRHAQDDPSTALRAILRQAQDERERLGAFRQAQDELGGHAQGDPSRLSNGERTRGLRHRLRTNGERTRGLQAQDDPSTGSGRTGRGLGAFRQAQDERGEDSGPFDRLRTNGRGLGAFDTLRTNGLALAYSVWGERLFV